MSKKTELTESTRLLDLDPTLLNLDLSSLDPEQKEKFLLKMNKFIKKRSPHSSYSDENNSYH